MSKILLMGLLLLKGSWGFSYPFRDLSHLSSKCLREYLHEHLSSNHSTISYKEARKLLLDHDRIDIYQSSEHSEYSFLSYLPKSYTHINHYTHKFNIEHIYPQSKTHKKKGQKSDLHNIFVCDSLLNQHRSNYRFGDYDSYHNKLNQLTFLDSSGNEIECPQDNLDLVCAKDNQKLVFIPTAASRGIISRAIAYMCFRYNLKLEKAVIDKQLILKWNQQFPPRDSEKIRNFWVHYFQGNRNIFIDHPEILSQLDDINNLKKK